MSTMYERSNDIALVKIYLRNGDILTIRHPFLRDVQLSPADEPPDWQENFKVDMTFTAPRKDAHWTNRYDESLHAPLELSSHAPLKPSSKSKRHTRTAGLW